MRKAPDRPIRETDREPRTQYAALPWRRCGDGAVEVLLITSRETRRWVIPKGWPEKKLGEGGSAAREALEEAGVVGRLEKKPLGVYHYAKRLRSGRVQNVRVRVFSLEVLEERAEWAEMAQRDKLWLPIAEAASRVAEPELRRLIEAFGNRRREAVGGASRRRAG